MPALYQPALYDSPIYFRKRRVGKCSIVPSYIKKATVVSARQALMTGADPLSVQLKKKRRTHSLVHDEHGVWMTDNPDELNQIHECIHRVRPSGRVLIGGLGLGVLATLVSRLPRVTEVTVVECDEDVIRLCGKSHTIVHADIMDFLLQHDRPYDVYLLDTWQGTGEFAWWDHVLPMRRLIRNRFGLTPKIHCWAEDIMLGQVIPQLVSLQKIWKYSQLPWMNPKQAKRFVTEIGTASWERKFGHLMPRSTA